METVSLIKLVLEEFQQGMQYDEYKNLIDSLLAENKSTGANQSEQLTMYSSLNQRRMKRWEKTLKISPEEKQKIEVFPKKMSWLVISEGWCGDAAHILPVLQKMASFNKNIDLRIVLRDDHEKLMNQFLTNGGKSIPKLIMIDLAEEKIIADWGPRPSTATEMVENYKKDHGSLDADFKEELQLWYNKDKGKTVVEDILARLCI